MIKYLIRSKELIDVVNDIKSKRLVMSPYFQRNLVWRQIHKIDFIKTILLGYPFPQIFVAKGSIDLATMTTTSCIVDGQQRMNSIFEFIKDEFAVDGRKFSEMDPKERESFLKYQIPIIDLDIDNEDPEIIEIFQRLNRTFYALSAIEKLSTEYAPSEFMLLAKYLVNEVQFSGSDEESSNDLPLQFDPSIPKSFIDWASTKKVKFFNKLLLEENIFTPYEISRQVHLMYTLNIMSTILVDYFNRNEMVTRLLDERSETFSEKDAILNRLERSASKFLKLKFKKKSYWLNKANAFSLLCLFAQNIDTIEALDDKSIREKLDAFENETPEEYKQAAKEAVNNKRERLIRNQHLKSLLLE